MPHGTSESISLEKPWIGGESVGSWVNRRAPEVPQIRHRLADFDQRFVTNHRGALWIVLACHELQTAFDSSALLRP